MDAEKLKSLGVDLTVVSDSDNDLIGFDPLRFKPFPSENLDEYRPFQNYLKNIKEKGSIETYDPKDPFDLGIFAIPCAQQSEIRWISTIAPSSQLRVGSNRNQEPDQDPQGENRTKDEEIVSSSLISFFHAISLQAPWCGNWPSHRLPFVVEFREEGYEAKVD